MEVLERLKEPFKGFGLSIAHEINDENEAIEETLLIDPRDTYRLNTLWEMVESICFGKTGYPFDVEG
jgi:hypothetical protein